jgi:hypothetical protein
MLFCSSILSIFGADMELTTPEGIDIVLHDDGTWDFKDRNTEDFKEDVDITLGDGRIILLTTHYEWRFVKKSELKKKNVLPVKSVNATGTGKSIDVAQAVATAHKAALDKVTYKLKSSIKNKKLNYKKLRDCVRRVEKDEDTTEVFTKGKGWAAKISIILDKGSILAVLDCESKKEEKKEEKKPEATGNKKEEIKAKKD